MANTELKRVNEVNGWKVNHPHSGANVVYAIFALIFSVFPVLFFYLALIANDPTLSGVDLFQFLLKFLNGAFSGQKDPMPDNPIMLSIIGIVQTRFGEAFAKSVYFVFIAMGGLLLLFLFFSFIELILAIVHLSKGYLRRPKAVKNLALTEFLLTILFELCLLYVFLIYRSATNLSMMIWYSLIPLGVSLFFLIFFAAMNNAHFEDSILEKDLEFHGDEPVVEHVSKVHEINKVNYEQSSTLPPNLTSIGGHAFAENQNLIVANIPVEVTKIGASAFANCLNLQVVSIPNTVKDIGFNCFFNCVELERINYAGTKAEWKKVRRGSNWLAKAKTTEVVCLDGAIVVNPYH